MVGGIKAAEERGQETKIKRSGIFSGVPGASRFMPDAN